MELVAAAVLAAKVWHYWIAPALVIGALFALLATVVGYYMKVERPKHPRG